MKSATHAFGPGIWTDAFGLVYFLLMYLPGVGQLQARPARPRSGAAVAEGAPDCHARPRRNLAATPCPSLHHTAAPRQARTPTWPFLLEAHRKGSVGVSHGRQRERESKSFLRNRMSAAVADSGGDGDVRGVSPEPGTIDEAAEAEDEDGEEMSALSPLLEPANREAAIHIKAYEAKLESQGGGAVKAEGSTGVTTISFSISAGEGPNIIIRNVLGKIVANLALAKEWNGAGAMQIIDGIADEGHRIGAYYLVRAPRHRRRHPRRHRHLLDQLQRVLHRLRPLQVRAMGIVFYESLFPSLALKLGERWLAAMNNDKAAKARCPRPPRPRPLLAFVHARGRCLHPHSDFTARQTCETKPAAYFPTPALPAPRTWASSTRRPTSSRCSHTTTRRDAPHALASSSRSCGPLATSPRPPRRAQARPEIRYVRYVASLFPMLNAFTVPIDALFDKVHAPPPRRHCPPLSPPPIARASSHGPCSALAAISARPPQALGLPFLSSVGYDAAVRVVATRLNLDPASPPPAGALKNVTSSDREAIVEDLAKVVGVTDHHACVTLLRQVPPAAPRRHLAAVSLQLLPPPRTLLRRHLPLPLHNRLHLRLHLRLHIQKTAPPPAPPLPPPPPRPPPPPPLPRRCCTTFSKESRRPRRSASSSKTQSIPSPPPSTSASAAPPRPTPASPAPRARRCRPDAAAAGA